jgi:hypothetical protein
VECLTAFNPALLMKEPARPRLHILAFSTSADYRFELFTDAGTDESRSDIQAFPFSIKLAFWQTAWFLALSIAPLVAASIGVTLYVQRRKNRALLDKLRTEFPVDIPQTSVK